MKVSDQQRPESDVQPLQVFRQPTGTPEPADAADLLSRSPRMLAQRVVVEALTGSPRMLAQRQMLGSLVGEAAQRQALSPSPTNRTGLPAGLKAGIESLSGMSLNHVKVHYDSSKPAQVNAAAYAQGSDIHIAPGREQHLPHEAWHVVQQAQGRVQPTMQTAGVAVNDDVGLEREADMMGARALVATQSQAQQSPAQRAAYSAHPPGWVTQLVNFPKDSWGSFSDAQATIDHGNEKTELPGGKLLDVILEEARKAGEESGGYRLGSFIYSNNTLTRKMEPDDEEHGMAPLPKDFKTENMDPYLKAFIAATLQAAGQLQYIEENKERIYAKHTVVIDVDCQFDRQGAVGFHKDSRGTTVFFNLNFNNKGNIQGPESYEDLVGNPGLEEKLPDVAKEDIELRREDMKKQYESAEQVPIESPELPEYARISLSDPNLWHSSPLFGQRNILASMNREQLLNILRSRYIDLSPEEVDAKSTEELAQDYSRAYHQHNAETASNLTEPDTEVLESAAVTRERRLSMNLKEEAAKGDSTLKNSLAAQSVQPRTFLRTWVRFVPI